VPANVLGACDNGGMLCTWCVTVEGCCVQWRDDVYLVCVTVEGCCVIAVCDSGGMLCTWCV